MVTGGLCWWQSWFVVLEERWVAAAAAETEPHHEQVEAEEYVRKCYENPAHCDAYGVGEETIL